MKRVRRGIGHFSACGIYGNISEDVLHSIRDCPTTRDIWNLLIPADLIVSFYLGGTHWSFNPALIRRILQLFSQFQHWSIFYIPREENEEADRLVKLTHLDSQGLQVFEVSSFGGVGYVM
ncbi:hypothetical protein Gotri_014167 [Gossypium trilobum]|uniref:RNase H type-1 domain-containing protein n=1 Tax=Gossypium trilobum TaxID=34281 RepID=A0A7J9DVW4_9ROSI|nr:hypothetical protein [Gossypium trilobum]